MSIKSLETFNIQSHRGHNIINLPPVGVIRFQGENNDGKSVITKVFDAVVRQKLRDPDVRKALVTTGNNYGWFKVTKYNGDYLLANVALEASQTYVEASIGGNVIKRFLSNGGIPELVSLSGYHYNEKRDISLNIYNTYDPLLMVTTPGVVNYDLIQSAIQDSQATAAIANIKAVRKESQVKRDEMNGSLKQLEYVLGSLVEYDVELETRILEEATALLNDLECLSSIPDTPDIKDFAFLDDLILITPSDNIAKLQADLVLPNEELIKDIEILFSITKIADPKEELIAMYEITEAIKNNVCPTCLRPHVDEGDQLCQTS